MKKKTPVVFPLMKDQSRFMTIIIGILTFLSVLALGIAIAIGTGTIRWNSQWENFATIQVSGNSNSELIQEILTKNSSKIESVHKFTNKQMQDLMQPWLSNNTSLENYLPHMWEVKFNNSADLHFVKDAISPHAKFLTHSQALKNPISAGWKLIVLSCLLTCIMLCAITICVSYIAKNTAKIHKQELEILNQIGANDAFVINQMRIIVSKICIHATAAGFLSASLLLLIILSVTNSVKIGLMAMLDINWFGWIILLLLPLSIIILAIFITKKTTLKILENN